MATPLPGHPRRAPLPIGLMLLLALGGCKRPESAPGERTELVVSAAASMSEAVRAVSDGFEATHPGVTVRLNLGASNALARQITLGAPVDLFLSAGDGPMDSVEAAGLIVPDSRRVVAGNRLVLIVPTGNPAGLQGLADMAPGRVRRLAVGAPGVPVRTYTEEALRKSGQWTALEPLMIPGENVRQVLAYVAGGDAEAGFVYATDAPTAAVTVLDTVPAHLHRPIRYPAAVLARSIRLDLARALLDHLTGSAGRDTLSRYGFGFRDVQESEYPAPGRSAP